MRIGSMELRVPINGKTAKEKCIVCGGEIDSFFAHRHDNICRKCWYEINKENSK